MLTQQRPMSLLSLGLKSFNVHSWMGDIGRFSIFVLNDFFSGGRLYWSPEALCPPSLSCLTSLGFISTLQNQKVNELSLLSESLDPACCPVPKEENRTKQQQGCKRSKTPNPCPMCCHCRGPPAGGFQNCASLIFFFFCLCIVCFI